MNEDFLYVKFVNEIEFLLLLLFVTNWKEMKVFKKLTGWFKVKQNNNIYILKGFVAIPIFLKTKRKTGTLKNIET